MKTRVLVVIVFVLLACKSGREDKNDDIAACHASGGTWSEGGCTDNGRCERPNGASPEDDDAFEDDAYEDETSGD